MFVYQRVMILMNLNESWYVLICLDSFLVQFLWWWVWENVNFEFINLGFFISWSPQHYSRFSYRFSNMDPENMWTYQQTIKDGGGQKKPLQLGASKWFVDQFSWRRIRFFFHLTNKHKSRQIGGWKTSFHMDYFHGLWSVYVYLLELLEGNPSYSPQNLPSEGLATKGWWMGRHFRDVRPSQKHNLTSCTNHPFLWVSPETQELV